MWKAIKPHMLYNRCEWFAGNDGLSIIYINCLNNLHHLLVCISKKHMRFRCLPMWYIGDKTLEFVEDFISDCGYRCIFPAYLLFLTFAAQHVQVSLVLFLNIDECLRVCGFRV